MMRLALIATLVVFFVALTASDKPEKLSSIRHFKIKIPEPSDVCLKPDGNGFYVVSDDGLLFELDKDWKTLRKAEYRGFDFEAVYADNQFIYVVEERSRKVILFDPATLQRVQAISTPYQGGRNKGFESLTWNASKQKFVSITERDPVYIYEFEKDFKYSAEYDFKIASDISSATYHNGKVYLLSDEDRTIFQLNANDYKLEKSWKIKVLNPEGIVIDNDGNLFIISDDLERVYEFGKIF